METQRMRRTHSGIGLHILSEVVGKPTIHDFCVQTYAHQGNFCPLKKKKLR